jgi:type I restriction-modification system DNA methylase subunit
MTVPDVIIKLIERFDIHRTSYLHSNEPYNETKLRQDYLDHFFIALGWDVYNKQGWSEQAREVSVEQTIKISGTTDFIDYSFKVGRDLMFIAEAKAPRVRIKDNAKAAHQVRRYAWNAKLPLCILTNFDEFAIYDCTKKPSVSDPAGLARIDYFTYKDLPVKWDELAKTFSKDAIFNGSFENFAKTTKGKKGTATVDEMFLTEIENWRDALAKNIALRNRDRTPPLTVDELNYSIQVIIDRIIFLQNCEDRGLEEYGALRAILDSENIYARLCELFRKADEKYNSGIFHFEKEPEREDPDILTPTLKIDDKVLKGIIRDLSEGAYEFSVIPPAILGQVYEKFLGKVIRLTEGNQARIEYKPDVKKAGGVFYTPQYIVEYIVKQTVGELVKEKTPREVAQFRILDPACGSGSFLIGAYQHLLDWHLEWYIRNLAPLLNQKVPITDPRIQTLLPEPLPKKKKLLNSVELPIYPTGYSNGIRLLDRTRSDWALSTTEKKRILIKNIFGVDIDRQAVEVTKLSLLLKVLEGEKEENLDKQLKITEERALPSLDKNIKCGNSLIGWDVMTPEMSAEEIKRINPFDWSKEFEPVMAGGGFDAVIGNPPYIRIQTMKEWAPTEVEFYKKKFISASKGNYDIYVVFVEQGLSLLNKNGLLGYILPHKFFNAQYGEMLRSVIAKGKHLKEIVHFGHQQVFENATTYTCLLFLGKKGYDEFHFYKVDDLTSWRLSHAAIKGDISSNEVSENEWNFVVGNDSGLFKKLGSERRKLKDVTAKIFQGLVTGADPVFLVINQEDGSFYSEATEKKHLLEKELLHPLCKGALNIRRYYIDTITKSILFPYKLEGNKATLLSTKELAEKYPNTWEYLKQNRALLEAREKGKWKHEQWYAFGRNQNLTEMNREKILAPSIADGACFTFDSKDFFYFMGSGGGGGGGYGIILKPEEKMAYHYLLGLLNSAVSTFYLRKISSTFSGGYIALNRQYIEQLPIRTINFADPSDEARHDRMVTLVTQMLDLNKRVQDARLEQEKTQLSRQIDATDGAIDKLVYELYGLTDEEIAIVEESGK